MGTNYVRYVDVDANAGGDGTTNALTGANCAFKSLSLAEAAGGGGSQPPLDLTSNSDTYTIICGSNHANHTADTTSVSFQGWTTSESCWIKVSADSNSRAGEYFSSSKYRISKTGTTNIVLCEISNFTLDGVQLILTDTGDYLSGKCFITSSSVNLSGILIDSCFLISRSENQATTNTVISISPNYKTITASIVNCIIINNVFGSSWNNYCIMSQPSSGTVNIYSCTIIGGRYGVRYGGTTTTYNFKNCYSGENYNACFSKINGNSATMTNCASSDTSAGSANGCISNVAYSSSSGACFGSVTVGSENLSISPSSTLCNAGTNTSAEGSPLNFSDDINGTTRSGAWDIGAYEYVVPPRPQRPFPSFKSSY